jgi:hypothetical protein
VSTLEETISTLKGYIRDLEEHGAVGEEHANINDLLAAHLDREKLALFDISNVVTSTQNAAPLARNLREDAVYDRRLPSAIDEMSAMVWKMNLCEDSTSTFSGPSGNFCFDPPTGASLSVGHPDILYSAVGMTGSDYLRDNALKADLMSLFMTKVNPYHQFVDACFQLQEEGGILDGSDLHLLQMAMCAAGSCYLERSDALLVGKTSARKAEDIALTCCRCYSSLLTVQALSALCWFELGQDHDNMAWIYNSTASAVALHLGLHVIGFERLASESNGNTSGQLERVRTFWSFSLMDRIATSILGR